jgi:hypothetical protein
MIPQLEAQTATDTLKNIFYEPVRNMPASFSEKKNYHSIGLSKFNQQKSFLLTENWLII